jgi:hypothetical protein
MFLFFFFIAFITSKRSEHARCSRIAFTWVKYLVLWFICNAITCLLNWFFVSASVSLPYSTGWTVRDSNPGSCKRSGSETNSQHLRLTQSPVQRTPGFFSVLTKRAVCKVYHSSPSSAEVKSNGRCTFTTPICLRGLHRDLHFLFPGLYTEGLI